MRGMMRLAIMGVPGASGAGGDPSDAFIAKLTASVDDTKKAMLEYVTDTSRYVWTPVDDACLWSRWEVLPKSTGFWALSSMRLYHVLSAVGSGDVSLTYSGTWTVISQGAAIAGTYKRASAAGAYVQFTFTGADKLYVIHSLLSNAGYANVTIDGSTALVNELPGAQLSCYKAGTAVYNQRTLIASGLDPETSYTVRITVTGTKPAESTDTRVYFEGYGKEIATVNDATVYSVVNAALHLQNFGGVGSVYEYAIQYAPAGASGYQWTGAGHLNEVISQVTWKDGDGADLVVSAETPRVDAGVIVLSNVGTSRHSETGETDHANVLCRVTFNYAGMEVYHRHDWLSAANVAFAYAAMYPVTNTINKGMVAGSPRYTLDSDNGTWHGQQRVRALGCWQAGTDYVAWMYIDDTTPVADWQASENYAFVEDRDGGGLNKMYLQRVGGEQSTPNAVIAASDVWESTAYYRVSHFADPDNNL